MTKLGLFIVEGIVGGVFLIFTLLTGFGALVLVPFAAMSNYIADTSDHESRNIAIVSWWLICTIGVHIMYNAYRKTKREKVRRFRR